MRILAIDRILPTATEEKIRGIVVKEAVHIWLLYSKEIIREFYFRKDRPGVVIVLECADINEAKRVLETFPLVRAGVIDFEIIPLGHFVPFGTLIDKSLLGGLGE
ncbi:MAG: hypothetical protein Fur0041_07780 [Bacteroidia bacterium]